MAAATIAAVVLCLWNNVAAAAKRLHDVGYSGKHILWYLALQIALGAVQTIVPWAGLLSLALSLCAASLLAFTPGQKGDNRWGAPPGQPARRIVIDPWAA